MTTRVGPKGQVVIPKAVRDAVGLRPGDEVDVTFDGAAVQVHPVRPVRSLRGTFAGKRLVEVLEAEHRNERHR
jgi:AbrB family looped-hinge helix DNA binding protein